MVGCIDVGTDLRMVVTMGLRLEDEKPREKEQFWKLCLGISKVLTDLYKDLGFWEDYWDDIIIVQEADR